MSYLLDTNIISEVRKGIELARVRDPGKAAALERWLGRVEVTFGNRVLGIDNAVVGSSVTPRGTQLHVRRG